MNAVQRALCLSVFVLCGSPSLAEDRSTFTTVSQWHFGTEETARLKPVGGIHRDQPGPRPPHFPDFEATNTAVLFDGEGSRFTLADPGPDSPYDFANGDTITLEAWVDLHALGSDRNVYIIGKGRTGNKGFASDNQNWAIRLREIDGSARVSFLFATKNESDGGSNWHRWTSANGFTAGSGWHRIAVSYTFGNPDSVVGWIDDKAVSGVWDMGGKTTQVPVVDDDEIWIGSSMNGSDASSFRGLIDAVSVYRGQLPDGFLAKSYHRVGDAPASALPKPTLASHAAAAGVVMLTIREGLATHNRWPLANEMPEPVSIAYDNQHWSTPYFLMPRMPHRYDAWGVRDSWKPPAIVHLAAEVQLPAGTTRLLVRNRGLGRLWVDGEVVLNTPAHQGSTDGHNPVDPLPKPPLPGHRIAGYGDTEMITEVTFAEPGLHQVVLESVVGGSKYRVETGEMLVAIQTEGSDVMELLRPAKANHPQRLLVDRDVEALRDEAERSLDAFDASVRRYLAEAANPYWNDRHQFARETVAATEPPKLDDQDQVFGAHPIDRFVGAKLATLTATAGETNASASTAQSEHFNREVLPILREHCFRCHGEETEGGLSLASLEGAIAGGDSGEPAITPNDPEASLLVARIFATDESERMPPSGKLTPEQGKILVDWIKSGATWTRELDPSRTRVAALVADEAFLRRLSLDTVGVPPSEAELKSFLADTSEDKRERAIDRLLADSRYADHWVSFWQDVLAENPNVLKPSLNNTGPFRFFLHESLQDNWAIDRMVTELLMFRGSEREGGSAGFGMAADNDAPLASRSYVMAAAFLGIDLQCARCHDSPYHSTKQEDLFSLAAMLSRKPVTVPKTSSVSPGFFENKGGRQSLIQVTLKPGVPVEPRWRFAETTGVADGTDVDRWLRDPKDTRERLAALITSPHNQRFSSVMVNHLWKRTIGAGIVELAHDWEGATPSDPALLAWLANEFVRSGYDAKYVLRLIFTSRLYQREAIGSNLLAPADERFFASPDRRRMSAEQIVDSLHFAAGREIDVEQLTFDPESRRPASTMISLGYPKRAWEFSTLSNERDRPSLALPRAQAVTDVLEAFGWIGSKQNPIFNREQAPGVLQPGMLANGVMASWITRASVDSELANLAVAASSPESLVESIYLRFLSRKPTKEEAEMFTPAVASGFDARVLPSEKIVPPQPLEPLGRVSWSNHLKPEANVIQVEMERRARLGDAPDPRLDPAWRVVYEDVVWSVIGSPEFVFIP